jgi:hypothetical protein
MNKKEYFKYPLISIAIKTSIIVFIMKVIQVMFEIECDTLMLLIGSLLLALIIEHSIIDKREKY